jgi:N-acetylneuraminic acid mutarotase
VVKFHGVTATTVTRTGSTFLLATVPVGATDGFVTVTTGATTLTSSKKFVVHNSWSSGKAIPVAAFGSASGFINGKIYVVSGDTAQGGAPVSNNQVYNPTSNSWTTAAAIPTPVFAPASAVVGGLLYVIGGYEGSSQTPTNLVQIYNPTTNKWTSGAAMPTARGSITAAVDSGAIYVIGGNGATLRLANVEKYVPATNTWTEEAPLLVGKSEPSAGLVGTTIVAAGGYTASGDNGDNEGYSVSTNKWSALTADPTPRNASCYGSLLGQLYVAGGINANPSSTTLLNLNESFNVATNKWTTQLAMPTAALWQSSTVASGQLYCIGGQGAFQGASIANVQIYQP